MNITPERIINHEGSITIPEGDTSNQEDCCDNKAVDIVINLDDFFPDNCQSEEQSEEEDVIDISNENNSLIPQLALTKYPKQVPYWQHRYVYSYNDLNSANEEQKAFYIDFKTAFFNSIYYDTEGNSNYTFVLLFDLLQSSNDLRNIENNIQKLGELYPKTSSYGTKFLIEKYEAINDIESVFRLRRYNNGITLNYNNQYLDNYWSLGTKYKEQLSLSSDQVRILNQITFYSNNFFDLPFCQKEIIKLFVQVISDFDSKHSDLKTNLSEIIYDLAKKIVGAILNDFQTQSQQWGIEANQRALYTNLFKIVENKLRDRYEHKRKLNTDFAFYNSGPGKEYEEKVIVPFIHILNEKLETISLPDTVTEIQLNQLNTQRWKTKFECIKKEFKEGFSTDFFLSVLSLADSNKNNLSLENIFFEASKFIAKYDKPLALSLYVYYLYHDIKSPKFDNKKLARTIQKELFSTKEQLHDFEALISELITTRNLQLALEKVADIYKVKRKRIKLNTESIEQVLELHSNTVDILSEYLKDDYEDDNNKIKAHEVNKDEIMIEITEKKEPLRNESLYTLPLSELQVNTILLFRKNNFTVTQDEIEKFAKSNGAFKSGLINSINEICFESLDDLIIEEEDDLYIMREDLHTQLLLND